jgi:hypothetical protein
MEMASVDAYGDNDDRLDHERGGTLMRVRALLSRVWCRHDYVRRVGNGRLYLECLTCRHTTAGVSASTRQSRPCVARTA